MAELEYTHCPLCESEDYKTYLQGKDYLCSQEDFAVVRCEQCKVLYTNPRISEEEIGRYYYSNYVPRVERTGSIGNRIRSGLGHLFVDSRHELVDLLNSNNGKSVLEIGPGAGDILIFLKEHGFQVCGVELDTNNADRIREKGIPCYLGDLDGIVNEISPQTFDAVVLCHVFEHLYHPKQTLKTIHSLLNEGGIVYVTLPNVGSAEAKLFGKYWRGLDLPRHIVHYSAYTIKNVLLNSSFCIVQSGNHHFPSSFVESIAFCAVKGKWPPLLYYPLYYLWKILSPLHCRLMGTGVVRIVARKV